MGSDTNRLPALDEDSDEFADTIVLTDSDVMKTRELRQLIDPDAEDAPDSGDEEDQG